MTGCFEILRGNFLGGLAATLANGKTFKAEIMAVIYIIEQAHARG